MKCAYTVRGPCVVAHSWNDFGSSKLLPARTPRLDSFLKVFFSTRFSYTFQYGIFHEHSIWCLLENDIIPGIRCRRFIVIAYWIREEVRKTRKYSQKQKLSRGYKIKSISQHNYQIIYQNIFQSYVFCPFPNSTINHCRFFIFPTPSNEDIQTETQSICIKRTWIIPSKRWNI